MKNVIQDFQRYTQGSVSKAFSTLLFNPCWKAVLLYREANWLYNRLGFRFLPRYLRYRARVRYGIDIDFRAQIGPGFLIVHGFGVVIGLDVAADKNLTVYQGVTLGGNHGKEKEYRGKLITQPHFGSNCTVSPGAIVIGPVVVGDNATIGAAALILKDIPSGCTVFNRRETFSATTSPACD